VVSLGLSPVLLVRSSPAAGVESSVVAPDTLFRFRATEVQQPPSIDGRIDEGEWTGAERLGDFIQFQPDRGAAASQPSEVFVLYDSVNLYVGFRGWDPEPVTAQLTRRDASLGEDDAFVVMLDTYRDRQSAYVFVVNPLGTQADLRIANDGRTSDDSWDAPWVAETVILSDGWSAEFEIPFSSLRYEPGNDRTWGINVGRVRRRTLEVAFWAGPLEHELRISQAGEMSGMRLPRPPRRAEGIVYGLSRTQEGASPVWDAGGDLSYAVTTGTSIQATVNPDFATIEADREQVNLTRFEVGLQEKRPFFLEGGELFRQRIRTFYSRRIADIRGGAKVIGKQGPWSFAGIAADAKTPEGEQGAFFGVGRVQRDIGRSAVAMTWADRHEEGASEGSVGLDATLFFSSTFGFTGQLVQSYGAFDEGTWAYFLRPSYDSPTGHFHVRYTHLGDRFADNANGVGFIRDDNRRELDSAIEKTIWIASGLLEQFSYESNYNIYWGQDGTRRSWKIDQGLDLELRNRWSLGVDYSEEFKRFEKDFRNRATELEIGYNTREFRSFAVGTQFGRNFDADFQLYSASARLKPTPSSSLEYELERLVLDPDPEDETTWIHVVRGSQFLTPDLFLQVFYQTNSVIDRRNLQAVFVYRYDPPFGTIQAAFQRGTAAFGERSEQGNTLFLKVTRVF
jgi:hypothetical protein